MIEEGNTMKRTLSTILISLVIIVVALFALLSYFPWQAALVLTLMVILLIEIIIAIAPAAFLSRPTLADGINDEDVLQIFSSMLKDVFTPDTILASTNTSRPYQILIDTKNYTIGREEGCNYVLPLGSEISRKHICIRYREGSGGYTVSDLGSTNGTVLNGEQLKPHQTYPIKNGDILAFAGIPFVIKSAYY